MNRLRALSRLRAIAARAFYTFGGIVALIGLLWMIWLPVFGDWRDIPLPLAVAWTGCIICALGLIIAT